MAHDSFDILRTYRRDVVKGIGAGAGLAAIGGTASAQQARGQESGTPTPEPTEGADDEDETGETGTVHTVRMSIRSPATNPERPFDFFYQPTGLHVEPGDVVRFVATTPDHNVVSYHPAFGMRRRVPEGVRAFSSPILGWRSAAIDDDQVEPPEEEVGNGEGDTNGDGNGGDEPTPDTWLHAFETPGVYDLLCSPHEVYGMAMRVVVGDETDAPFETSDPDALEEPRAGPVGLARLTLTDPALDPEEIVDEGTVLWESLETNQEAAATEDGTPDTSTDGNTTDGNASTDG